MPPNDAVDSTAYYDALSTALQAVATASGCPINADDLSAALGLSFMTCAARDSSCPQAWSGLARDALLIEAARPFGITVRGLHPPEAARGLDQTAEYEQHFDASYRPLILRALENGQAVLAWLGRGEFGNHHPIWGTIEGTCDGGVGLRGKWFPRAPENPPTAILAAPPVQVYVVESIRAVVPKPGELLPLVLEHARRVWSGSIGRQFGVTTGPDAYDAWIDRLSADERCPGCGSSVVYCHQCLTQATRAAHASAVRYLDSAQGTGAAADQFPLIALRDACQEVVDALADSADVYRTSADYSAPSARLGLMSHVASARGAVVTAMRFLAAGAPLT